MQSDINKTLKQFSTCYSKHSA